MNKLLSLAAVAAVATLTVPMTVAPAAARDHHHGWKKMCRTTWDRHHHRRTRVCHRTRW